MLLLAHVGLALGFTKGLEKVLSCRGMNDCTELIDYRLVFGGSMLPDVIDKPLGGLILGSTLGNGRIYCHTLLFQLFLLISGIYLCFKYKRPELFVAAGGSAIHCILDGMWYFPETFLWPVYGWSFPEGDPGNWLRLWVNLLADPKYYIPEILGGAIIIVFFTELVIRKNLYCFLVSGKVKGGITPPEEDAV
ncbi:MAG: metal-dependent hydrolase [Firmicutes bacterium]|nr:metal-dependent hydrolase [Bacillota bacterium]